MSRKLQTVTETMEVDQLHSITTLNPGPSKIVMKWFGIQMEGMHL